MKIHGLFFAMAVLVFMSAVVARAQIDSGLIVGTIQDVSGAVLGGASVHVINQATGIQFESTTNSSGQYQSQPLIPGIYTVSASAKGFAPSAAKNIRVDVQSHIAINLSLKVGDDTESITVTADAVGMLQTQSADLGNVVDTKTLNELPLNGRNYAQLALLEPGVGKYYAGPNEVSDGFSVNGNSELQNYFTLDGIDNNSNSANLIEGSVQAIQPSPDALDQFRIQTRTYSAEFGNAAGGVINASIKSGTNEFHGSAWDFLRNDALDANSFFNSPARYNVAKTPYKQNQYGATFGGPIRRNRTFFFSDFQQVIIRQQSTQTATVPTPLMKGTSASEPGVYDFREVNGVTFNPVVPSQAGCVINNIVQTSCLDSVGVKLLQGYPDPNIPSQVALEGTTGSFSPGTPNYKYIVSVPNNTWSADGKIDQTLNENNRIYGRYSIFRSNGHDPQWTANPIYGAENFAADSENHGQSFVVSYIRTLSSSMLNEARVGYTRNLGANNPPSGLALGQSAASQFGLTGVPVTSYTYGLPTISVGGLQSFGDSTYRPQHYASQVYQFFDDFSWLKGRHSFKFGYQYHRFTSNFLDLQNVQGAFGFSGQYSTNGTSFGATDMLLGDANSASYETLDTPHEYQPGHNFYAQDTWRITDQLTLTYGLRYELYSPLLERNNNVAAFSPNNNGEIVTADHKDDSWYGKSFVHPDDLNFAPRFGFTYQFLPRVVFRGGYGIFYQHTDRYGSEGVPSLNAPYLVQSSLSQSIGSTTPVFQLKNGFPASQLEAQAGVLPPLYTLTIRWQDPNRRTAYVSQPSFGTQVQIAPKTTFSLDYVGNFARKMGRIMNANEGVPEWDAQGNFQGSYFLYQNLINWGGVGPSNPHWFTTASTVEYVRGDGNANFNSMQASLDHRLTKGITFGVSYQLSHAIQDFNVPINGNYIGQNSMRNHAGERSDSTLDVRNRFVAHALWNLPIGRGTELLNATPVVKDVVSGWQINAIVTAQNGNPFTIYGDQGDQAQGHDGYADCVSDPFAGATKDPKKYVSGGGGFYINPSAYGNPTSDSALGSQYRSGHFGTCHPYSVHAPGWRNTDLSVLRSFNIHGNTKAEFRAEGFNAWNNVNFGTPYGYIGVSSSFGKVFGTTGSPRNIQFALKISY
jgi:hypothetical protein